MGLQGENQKTDHITTRQKAEHRNEDLIGMMDNKKIKFRL